MKRLTMLLAVALGLAGCGSSDSPSVSQVVVTVLSHGSTVANTPVVASADIDPSSINPTGVIATQNTSSSGQTTFTVPSSTTSGKLCFSSLKDSSFDAACYTLNSLPATLALEHW
jgi:ABC-type glycerol-3-phosphate transport system substrate-binding protein